MKKKSAFKDKEAGELKKLLTEKRDELRALRFAAAGARPKDTNAEAKTRHDIARILTELAATRKVAK